MNSLPKTVTRQHRACDLNPGPSAPESSTLTTRLTLTLDTCNPLTTITLTVTLSTNSMALNPTMTRGQTCRSGCLRLSEGQVWRGKCPGGRMFVHWALERTIQERADSTQQRFSTRCVIFIHPPCIPPRSSAADPRTGR